MAALLNVLFLLTALAAPLAWVFDPWKCAMGPLHLSVSWGWKPLLAPAALLAARLALPRPPAPRWLKRVALALAAALLPLVLLEQALTWAGVSADLPPLAIQGEGRTMGRATVSDAELLWRFIPGAEFNGRRINGLGYLGRAPAQEKPAGTRRVLCLGDSCTAQGAPPYSDLLQDLLRPHPPEEGGTWESFNMAVHGYSVRQGLRLFQRDGRAFSPDVVTLYFGWNDHWLAEETDRARMARSASPFPGRLLNGLRKKRLYCALARALGQAAPRTVDRGDRRTLRVPPEDYTDTLGALIGAIRQSGARPIVLTAPRASKLTGLLVHNGHARSQEEAARLHDAYVERTRQVARATGTELLDLAQLLEAGDARALFSRDGIHLTDEGRALVARELCRVIAGVSPASTPLPTHP